MTKEAFLIKVGENVVRLREKAGLSQSDLASMCDKNRQSINRLEHGRINPSIYYLQEIAAGLEVSLKELLDI